MALWNFMDVVGCRKPRPCPVSCGFSGFAESCRTGKPRSPIVLLRLFYLPLTGIVTFLRLLPMSSTDKNIEILTLRHQLAVLQRSSWTRCGGPIA